MIQNIPLIENILTLSALSFNLVVFIDLGEGFQKYGCLVLTCILTEINGDNILVTVEMF
jgi:hypothetical protein